MCQSLVILPQFLPGNVELFGRDGDGDLRVDVFTGPDAIHSVANFLLHHGWTADEDMDRGQMERVVWAYNRSDSYVKTVLTMADKLAPEIDKVESELEDSFKSFIYLR